MVKRLHSRRIRTPHSGRLGFNAKFLIEMGQETGSPGLDEVCAADRFSGLARGGQFRPVTEFARGRAPLGNWGGMLRNPAAVLSHALASTVDARGSVTVRETRPPPITAVVRRTLDGLERGDAPGDPVHAIPPPGITYCQRRFALGIDWENIGAHLRRHLDRHQVQRVARG